MFFPEKIKNIKENDRVLEIGPGGTPFTRSDVFLELIYDDENEFKQQRGNTDQLITKKPVIYYEGKEFPFNTNEFEYVICSHVLEHVEDVEFFLSEMFRVAPRGYIEYPTIIYEYIYNFKFHLNFLKFNNDTLFYLKKSKTNLNDFYLVQAILYESLQKGNFCLVNDLKNIMFEGFEWKLPFSYSEATDLKDLLWTMYEIPSPKHMKQNFFTKIFNFLCK